MNQKKTLYFIVETLWGLQIVRTTSKRLNPSIVEAAIGRCDWYTQIGVCSTQDDAIDYVRKERAERMKAG